MKTFTSENIPVELEHYSRDASSKMDVDSKTRYYLSYWNKYSAV